MGGAEFEKQKYINTIKGTPTNEEGRLKPGTSDQVAIKAQVAWKFSSTLERGAKCSTIKDVISLRSGCSVLVTSLREITRGKYITNNEKIKKPKYN